MNISKRKQGILAIICTIAMIVTSITVYNPREVKADTDYSKLTYNYKNKGEAFMKGSENTKSPWKVAIDESQSKGDIVNWMTTGDGNLNFYNGMFMNVTWHGNYPDATVEINSVKVEKEGNGVQVFNPAEIHVNAKEWINNNAYNVVKVTSKDGSQYVTFIVATGDKAVTSSEETTTRDPSAVVWKDIANGSGYSYNDNTEVKVENVQKPSFASEQGIYMTVSNTIESVTINGVDSKKYKTQGAGVVVYLSGLVKGENTINIKYTGGEATVIIKNENEVVTPNPEETTTAAYKDGEVLVNESNKTIEVPSYSNGDYWQNEYNNKSVKYVKGKKYVAEVVVSSTAAKKIKMVFQKNDTWDLVGENSEYEVSIAAGNKVKITYVFEATQSTDDGIFDIHLGSVADATTLVFESKKLTTYNEVPDGVQTGVEVLEAPGSTQYTVSIDGKSQACKEGAKIAVPADGQGYYNVTKKEAYAPGTELTVNENMTLKSIALNVTMTKGASIRLAAPTGLRFQTTVKSGNGIAADEILNSKTVTTGTLITTLDLYTTHGNTLTKESASIYTVLDIANNGWFGEESNKETGKFCGSIINIQKENYGRKFIAVGYATINYLNGKSKTVYAEVTENNAKSIQYVAEKVQKSAAYDKYTHAQQGIIEKYIKGEEISK
ncbi:MAG: hypothetical protein EGR36_08100 [Eubacterium ventriosum]|uniref:hypothetical protein n=1 Tax=Eubacterium ventriosum TaxID=39496 RepID=UPI001DF4F9C7|nr:hypothetical protein [Eubacterium ventriosum]MBD9055950.1 hypothetical protein [Eubacterium ventriosum]